MKKIISSSLILLMSVGFVMAQDCTSAADCLAKAKKNQDKNRRIALLDEGLKFAKKEGVNPAEILVNKAIYLTWHGFEYNKDAVKACESAIKANDRYYPAYSWLEKISRHDKPDFKKSIKTMNNLVAEFPNQSLVYYDRADTYRFYKQASNSLADFEKAFVLLATAPENADQLSAYNKDKICLDYCTAYMDDKKLYVYDNKSLEILKVGDQLGSQNPLLLGKLSMAYYDNNNEAMAKTIGDKAKPFDTDQYDKKNVGGNFLEGFANYQLNDFRGAATPLWNACNHNGRPHPMINFYAAMALWQHNASVFDTSPHLWRNQMGVMKQWLNNVVTYGKGTKYANLVAYAEENLSRL